MATLATLVVKLIADAKDMNDELEKSSSGVKKWASKIGNNIQSIGKIALGGITGGVLALGGALATIGPQAKNAASDLSESLSKVNVVFGGSAATVTDFASTAAMQLGISESAALAAAGTYGNLFRTMELGSDTSAQMSTDLVQLSADLASFNNLDPTEVLDKLRSGLVGETEPLRSLGINLTDAAVRARAVEMGLAATTKEVDQAAMTQARFALIMEQSALAQGDFARTSDGLANQERILGAVWQNVLAKIGGVALPLLTGALGGFLGLLQSRIIPTIDKVVGAFDLFQGMLADGVDPLTALKSALSTFLPPDVAAGITGALQTIVSKVQDLITWATPIVNKIAAWISENVKLQDVLLVIGGAIATVVVPAIASIVAAAAPVIATFVVLVAAVAAMRKAWETNFLGVRDIAQAVADFWTGTLVPAFQQFFNFLKTTWWPLLRSVGNFLGSAFKIAAEAVAGVWQNVLAPAFRAVGDVLNAILKPALTVVEPLLDKLKNGVGGISGAIEKLIGWFDRMAGKLDNISLPDWMTPGSPTPLEIGLRGIGGAMRDLSTMQLPALSSEFSQVQAPAASSDEIAGKPQVTIYGGLTLSGVQDMDGLLGQLQALGV